MSETSNVFLSIRGMIKLYDQHLEGIRTEYGFTLVLHFLRTIQLYLFKT